MKRFLLTILLGSTVCLATGTVQAHEYDEGNRAAYAWFGGHGLDESINHLNRMVGHVRWQLGRYHPDGSIRREFAQVREEVDHVNARHRSGDYDRRHLLREIESLHARLHQLEVRMHVRTNDFYGWR